MSSDRPRRIWITGASNGLGHALAEALLEQGCKVALSVRNRDDAHPLETDYPGRVLVLAGDLHQLPQARRACATLTEQWQAIDGLIVNAGTCDYLPLPITQTLLQDVVRSNLAAASHCLDGALPLLDKGRAPQVVGILSAYSALQLGEPGQPRRPANSIASLFEDARPLLVAHGIDLTIVAPQKPAQGMNTPTAIPDEWDASSAASAILQRLGERPQQLTLQALAVNELWPLPK